MLSQEKSLQEFRRLGWKISGTLDNVLGLYKAPSDSRLRARIRVEKIGETYQILGLLYAVEEERIAVIDGYSYANDLVFRTLMDLERLVCGKLEAYLSGSTNIKPIKEIYKKYKIR